VKTETGFKGALDVAEIMRANIENQNITHEKSKVSDCVTISVGVATWVPEKDSQSDELIAMADQALYEAKEQGRNRVISFGVKMN